MKKISKKFLLIILCGIFATYAVFISAANLEVKYPPSPSGFAPTSTDTPLADYLKYIFDIGMFIGFASAFYGLAYAGVLYLMSPAKPELLASAKDWVWGAVSGILILVMTYLIITTINPQLAFFKIKNLESIPPPNIPATPGIYFYKSNNCSGDPQISSTNILDFGTDWRNQVNSAKMVNGTDDAYVSTVYENPGLFGMCLDIDPTTADCQPIKNIGNSASIHIYDFSPKGDGVYIYRKPFFNTEGGWLKISNSEIDSGTDGGVFGKELKDLTFNGDSSGCTVPKEEQICEQWDEKGICAQKKCPSLAGKEMSSIKIAGNYIVFLIYLDPADTETTWSYCQEFPTPNDLNREGPAQLKWEKSANQENLPNWIYIYPVKEK